MSKFKVSNKKQKQKKNLKLEKKLFNFKNNLNFTLLKI